MDIFSGVFMNPFRKRNIIYSIIHCYNFSTVLSFISNPVMGSYISCKYVQVLVVIYLIVSIIYWNSQS